MIYSYYAEHIIHFFIHCKGAYLHSTISYFSFIGYLLILDNDTESDMNYVLCDNDSEKKFTYPVLNNLIFFPFHVSYFVYG